MCLSQHPASQSDAVSEAETQGLSNLQKTRHDRQQAEPRPGAAKLSSQEKVLHNINFTTLPHPSSKHLFHFFFMAAKPSPHVGDPGISPKVGLDPAPYRNIISLSNVSHQSI